MRGIGTLTTLAYFALAAWALFCWMPEFFDINEGLGARLGPRFVAATGIPLALLLLSAAYRQARLPGFSPILFGQVLAAGLLLLVALQEFYALRPATVLCFLHILLCAVLIPWMLLGWRGGSQAAA